MGSRDGILHWSVLDGVKIIPSKPEALMADINSAISSLEYAKATNLLNSSIPLFKDVKKRVDDRNPNSSSSSSYDAQIADEAYKAGLMSLSAGKLEEAFGSLNVALSKCPPHKISAISKLQTLISLMAQQLGKSPR